jgi:hypothetical protein
MDKCANRKDKAGGTALAQLAEHQKQKRRKENSPQQWYEISIE